MKKNVLVLAALVAGACCFTACDDLVEMDLVGHINLTTSNATAGDQAYADGQTLNFKSALCNINIDTALLDAGTVMVGATQSLVSNDVADITFPLCGINLRDTVPGQYAISCPVTDFSFFEYLNESNVNMLITRGLAIGDQLGNLFAVAVSDTSFYLGYSGAVNITAFGTDPLSRVQGTVSNVEAIYLTASGLEAIANMSAADRANIDLTTYFPHITFNGDISSIRSDIDAVMQALEDAE
jgi:hypothetical protein